MTNPITLFLVAVSGFMGIYALHFVYFVLELDMDDHYLMQFLKRLSKYVPDMVFIFVGALMVLIGLMMFVVTAISVVAEKDATLFIAYIFGSGVYLLLVPFRVTYFPFLFGRLFPERYRKSE